jgi:uncharacterized membrane protein
MISLLLAALVFAGIHLGISGTTLRDALVARLGQRGYMLLFSVASLVTMVWLVMAYNMAPYQPSWGQLQWWKPFQLVLMLPAFILVVAGLSTPNPTAFAGEGHVAAPPQGIVRVTRHPFLVGVFLWAAVHLIGNGDVASLLFFGSLAVVCAAGTVSIDAKRRRVLGAPAWDAFAGQTSIVPFAAMVQHRTSLAASGIGWWRPSAGVAAYAIVLGGHSHLFGVNPFPG